MTSDKGKPSKTQRKKQVTALQKLGEELVELRNEQLVSIDLPESLLDAVVEARRIASFEARRRQMQYIGKLMRKVDAAPIRAALDALQAGPRREAALHKRADSWRERLLTDDHSLADLLNLHPRADARRLRELIRGVKSERAANAPPRSYRALFRLLRQMLEPKGEEIR